MARVVHADWIIPGDVAPIGDGAIVLNDEDVIVEIGRAGDVLPHASNLPCERVRGILFPALVNAHTHLELSALRGRIPGGRGFVDWVDRLVAHRSEVTSEEEDQAVSEAVSSFHTLGIVAIGEVTNSLAAVHALARARIVGCIFHEIFGWNREQLMIRLHALEDELRHRIGSWPTSELSYAPAAHTLYTTHPEVAASTFDASRVRGTRTSLHLAEHAFERRAIEHGDGPIPDWITTRTRQTAANIAWPRKPLFDYADALGALHPNVLLVHLTDATQQELDRVAHAGAPVVLCPRSNFHIDLKLPPLLEMRQSGINPALGTDSLASNVSLDVLAEAKWLRDHFPQIPAWEFLKMATTNGAVALGRTELGALQEKTAPGILAVEAAAVDGDPAGWLLNHLQAPRRWIARRGTPKSR